MPIPRTILRSLLPTLVCTAAALAQRTDEFTFHHVGPIGVGNAAYVLGDLDELGGGQLARAIRMSPVGAGNWEIAVRLPINRTFQYSIWERSATNPSLIGLATHGTLRAGPLTASTATRLIAPASKRLGGYVPIAGAVLNWRQDQGAFQQTPLQLRGGGRAAGEWLYEAPAFGSGQLPVDFFFTDAAGAQRVPATGSLGTPLDAFFVQDGQVFTYWPAPVVHAHRRDYAPNNLPTIFSPTLGQSRSYRVLLPRGYDDHPARRYPVIWFHDGPWMFDAGNPILYFSDVIDPNGDTTAGLVQRGEMGECILVGVDWGTTVTLQAENARARDYLPPGSGNDFGNGSGFIAGAADRYAQFLINELKPHIDATYRTKPGRATTFVAGFSFGGIASAYLGWDHGDVFSRVGLFSPSLWVPSFPNRLLVEPLHSDLRIYLDSGFDNYSWTANTRDNWLRRAAAPYRLETQLRYAFDPLSSAHTPTEVNRRLPAMARFLYPASEEDNEFLRGAVSYGSGSGPSPLTLSWQPVGATDGLVRASAPASGAWSGIAALALAPGDVAFAGIQLLFDPSTLLTLLDVTADASGIATQPLDLSIPTFAGVRVHLQVARIDSNGLSASNGLELDLGR